MRVIVPLQGVVQGRGGLVLGSVIPCAFFYFLQFYLKRNRKDEPEFDPANQNSPDNSDSSSPTQSELTGLSRSLSRVISSPRNSGAHVSVSGRANSILKGGDSPYHVGQKRVEEDPYDESGNPDGIIELGLAQNKVKIRFLSFLFAWFYEYFLIHVLLLQLSLDVIKDWVSHTSIGLSLSGIASYEPSDGLMELKMVIFFSTVKFSTFIDPIYDTEEILKEV